MQVVFRSAFFSPGGYGSAAREIALAMEEAGVDLKLENIGDRYEFLAPHVQTRLEHLESRPLRSESLLLTVSSGATPAERAQFKRVVTCVMWETSKAPPALADPCQTMDAMIVPNNFNKEAFRNAGVKIPIYTAPYGVNSESFSAIGPTERFGEPDDHFVFLSIFGWSDRKGPDALLRAYVQEFDPDEPVVLFIKTHGLTSDHFPRHLYDEVMSQLKVRRPPKIQLITEAAPVERMAALMRGSDCFVLPTRGEGFGLPILESMACGVPAIATGWSGHMDFLNPDNGYVLPFTLVPAHPLWWTDLYQPDQLWAEPDVGALQSLMRRAYRNRAELRVKGNAARATAEGWTWNRTAEAFIRNLEQIAGTSIRLGSPAFS